MIFYLQETRIGKSVNEMRRKTSDEQLAKRAKKLVRSWQKVVSGSSESNTSINGEEVAGKGTPQVRAQGLVKKPISPAVAQGKVLSPAVGKGKVLSPAVAQGKVLSPAVAQGKPVNRPVNPNSVNSSLSSRQPNSKPTTPQLQNVKHSSDSIRHSISSPQLVPPGSAKRFCISPNSRPLTPQTPDSASSRNSKQSLSSQDKSWAVKPTTPSAYKASSASTSKLVSPPNSVVTDSKTIRRAHSSDNLQRSSSPVRTVHSTGDLTLTIRKPSSSSNGEQNGCVKPSRSKERKNYSKALEAAGLVTESKFKHVANGAESTPILEPTPKRKRGRPRKHKLEPSPEETFSKAKYMSKSASTSKLSKSFSEKRNVNLGIKTEFDSSSRDKFVSLTPKVKSTAELMQVLQAKNSLSVGKDTAHQIEANLIPKEHDTEDLSVVPASAKPRPRRKPGTRTELIPPSTPVSLQTKTEMVEKFLQTSVNETPDDLSPIKFELPRTESPSASTSLEDVSEHQEGSKLSRQSTVSPSAESNNEQIKSKSVITDESQCDSSNKNKDKAGVAAEDKPLSLDEIYSKYPVLDLDNFVFDDGEYDIPEALEINDGIVSRIHDEHWSGVNGVYDSYGDWRDWTQTLSLEAYQGDPIHILPYVNIDD